MSTNTAPDVGATMRRGRWLQRFGLLTAKQFVLLDAIVFSCRPKRSDKTGPMAYSLLRKRVHQAHSTLVAGVKALEAYGLIHVRRDKLLAIGSVGGMLWCQLPNVYTVLPLNVSRESDPRTDSKRKDSFPIVIRVEVASSEQKDAQEALRRIREARTATLFGWQGC